MKWFYNLKIGAKLHLSFALVAAIAGLIGWIGLSQMNRMRKHAEGIYADRLLPIQDLADANIAFANQRINQREIAITPDAAKRRDLARGIDVETRALTERMETYSHRALAPKEMDLLNQFRDTWKRYLDLREPVIDLALAGQGVKALGLMQGELHDVSARTRSQLRALISLETELAGEEQKRNEAAAVTARNLVLGWMGVAVALAVVLVLSLARLIGRPLRAMQEAAARLAAGDVGVSVELDTRDELGALARSFREMIAAIGEQTALAQKIATGDVSVEARPRSEQDVLGKSFAAMLAALRKLVAESESLAGAATAGRLTARAQADEFQGSYRDILKGFNRTLDAVITPLNVAALYVERISKGNLPPQITDTYQGEFNTIKSNLNALIAAMEEVTHAAQQIAEGNLTVQMRERSGEDKLMQALASMVSGLTRTVTDIRAIAGEVGTASQGISTASVQVSNGASAQSASCEVSSYSMEQM